MPFISGGPGAGFHLNIDAAAAEFCASGWACQVCGLPTGLDDWVIVAAMGGAGDCVDGWSVLDHAPLHLPCLRMTVRLCPHLNDVSELNPEYVAMYLMCGDVLSKLARKDEARAWYEAGIAAAKAKGDAHALGELESALAGL